MNTNDAITQNDDKVTFSSNSNKVYYQGDLEDVQIPWDISIKYYLDGVEYSPKDIANKSGKLEIKFKISQNNECNSTFFENYAVQCSLLH